MDEIFITYQQYTFFLRRRCTLPDIAPAADGSNVLDERERLIAYFQTHEEERIQVLTRVNEVKKIWKMSIADYIDALKDVDRERKRKIPSACRTFGSGNCRYADPPDPVYVSVASDALRQCGGSYTGFQKD